MQSKENTYKILNALDQKFGEVKTFLTHNTPFQLLISVILSAQTTDVIVNKVTPALFEKYPDEKALKNAELADVERLISKVNYFRTKARNIIATAKMLDEEFGGEIPYRIEDLIKFPGVGRKVANVIVADIFGMREGFVVDTHVKRVSYRIGWTKQTDPVKVELDIMKIVPKENYVNTPKQLILIGRNYCFPRNPNCPECPLFEYCEKNILEPVGKTKKREN